MGEDTKIKKEIELQSEPIARVAKYSNNVNVGFVNDNKSVVISFMSMDDSEHGVLIERIIVDREHAKKIADLLNDSLQKNE
jgi:hypothetical protein